MRTSLRVVVLPPVPLKRLLVHIHSRLQDIRVEELQTLPLSSWEGAALGKDMARLPINGRVPIPKIVASRAKSCTKSLRSWLARNSLPCELRNQYTQHRKQEKEPTLDHGNLEPIIQLCGDFSSLGREFTCTVEDKDPNSIWMINPQ